MTFSWLGDVLQIALIEGSHFIGSLVGMGLLLLAYGLERQLRSAFHLTVGLLLLGIPAAIISVGDVRSAAVLVVLLLMLLAARGEFTRTIPFSEEPLNAGWLAAIGVAVLGIAWLGIYLGVRDEYTSSLWWKFELNGDAPRALRATLSILLAVVIFVAARFISRSRHARQARKAVSRRTPAAARPRAKAAPRAARRRK